MDLRDAIHVIGLTCEGDVPLLRIESDDHDTIALPGVTSSGGGGGDATELEAVNWMLSVLGYRAAELVTMSRFGIPTGSAGRSTVLLAPLLERARGPGLAADPGTRVHEIPLARCAAWLREQRSLGARVDPTLWVGLLLAQRHFPRWAHQRLRASLNGLRHRGFRPPPRDVAERSAPEWARDA